MSSNEAFIWTKQAKQQLDLWQRQISAQLNNQLRPSPSITFGEKEIRRAITVGYDGTDEDPLAYPDPPANTFWVKLGKPSYTNAVGDQLLTFTAYDPPEYRLVYNDGGYLSEGTVVWIQLIHGQYFIQGDSCEDLKAGSYPAVAGENISAGATGSIVYQGVVYEVVNHSVCDVKMGNEIVLHVSPNCEKFFTACVCDCAPADPEGCGSPFAICINGVIRVYSGGASDPDFTLIPGCINHTYCGPSGTDNSIPALDCFPNDGIPQWLPTYLEGKVFCNCPGTSRFDWTMTNLEGTYSGSENLPGFCDDPMAVNSFTITGGGCPVNISIGPTIESVACVVAPNAICCSQSKWFCFNNEAVLLPLNGGNHIWSMADCFGCPTGEIELTLSCNESTNETSLHLETRCNGEPPNDLTYELTYSDFGLFCTSDSPREFFIPWEFNYLKLRVTDTEEECFDCIDGPEGCCSGSRWFCVNGDSRQLALDGGDETWDVTDCCYGCTSATLRNRITCNSSTGVVSLQQTYTCDGVTSSQATTLSPGICNSTAPIVVGFSTGQCFLTTTITSGAYATACDSCDSCCDEARWYCINNQSKQMTLAGDSDTFDVADCCDCTTATLTLEVECIGLTNTLRYDWSLVCDGGVAITGFDFLACDASVLNIEAGDCFLQVEITTTDVGCAECGGETTTIIPPP